MTLDPISLGTAAIHAVTALARDFATMLVLPGSVMSISSLASTLVISGAIVLCRKRTRPVSLRLMARALFPRRMLSRSSAVDLGLFFFNTVLFGALFGWTIVSQGWVSDTLVGLIALPAHAPLISGAAALIVGAVALFLAAEFGAYLIHRLCHRIPAFWELHKVHHSAEALTSLTLFRVHPLEGVLFANTLAITMGVTDALLTLAFGPGKHGFAVFDRNVIALAGLYLVQHLQHTEFWVMAPGPLRKLIHSPAHHQIHHSDNPAHFGKNLGGLLTVWDWMFGTLLTPDAKRPALTFGLGPDEANHYSVSDAMARPVLALLPKPIRRRTAAARA